MDLRDVFLITIPKLIPDAKLQEADYLDREPIFLLSPHYYIRFFPREVRLVVMWTPTHLNGHYDIFDDYDLAKRAVVEQVFPGDLTVEQFENYLYDALDVTIRHAKRLRESYQELAEIKLEG